MDILGTIIELRKVRKISLSDMAEAVGVIPLTLRRYEKGRREMPIGVFLKYVDKLGCEIRILIKNSI